MKKNYFWSIILCLTAPASLTALTACNDDETFVTGQTDNSNPVTITAQIAGQPSTRLVYGDDTGAAETKTNVYWSAGTDDQFTLHWKGTTARPYLFKKVATLLPVASASFTCDDTPPIDSPTTVYAIYPGNTKNNANTEGSSLLLVVKRHNP